MYCSKILVDMGFKVIMMVQSCNGLCLYLETLTSFINEEWRKSLVI